MGQLKDTRDIYVTGRDVYDFCAYLDECAAPTWLPVGGCTSVLVDVNVPHFICTSRLEISHTISLSLVQLDPPVPLAFTSVQYGPPTTQLSRTLKSRWGVETQMLLSCRLAQAQHSWLPVQTLIC